MDSHLKIQKHVQINKVNTKRRTLTKKQLLGIILLTFIRFFSLKKTITWKEVTRIQLIRICKAQKFSTQKQSVLVQQFT